MRLGELEAWRGIASLFLNGVAASARSRSRHVDDNRASHRGNGHTQERSGPAIASLVAFATLLLTFVTALLRALLWFLRGAFARRSLVLALRPWHLLLLALSRSLL